MGLTTVSKQDNDMPEDKKLSSGYSVIRGNMVKIDNYANVKNYAYKLENQKKTDSREKRLVELNYRFVDEIDIFHSFEDSEENVYEYDEYPQGLCMTDEYVFISSYSGEYGGLGKVKVYDKTSGEHLLSLGMDENSHLGGLTYDGKHLWVCNSSKMMLEKISYTFVKQMIAENKGQMIDVRNLMDGYRVNNIPSCVTFYDGKLWVATHSIWTNSIMINYTFREKDDVLMAEDTMRIPPKVQGVAFAEDGEVYMSTSYGRKKSSYIKKYHSVYSMINDLGDYTKQIELPPCSEEIVWEEDKLYVLFESAGRKYMEGMDGKGKSSMPLDKILVIQK